jgi:hypothetical protein
MGTRRTRFVTLILSGAVLLSFLARTLVDNRFVYAELDLDPTSYAWMTAISITFYAIGIAALVLASHGKRWALYVLLAYSGLLVAFGVVTQRSLCPSPCLTAWPVGEIANWSNLVIGIPATILVGLAIYRERGRNANRPSEAIAVSEDAGSG